MNGIAASIAIFILLLVGSSFARAFAQEQNTPEDKYLSISQTIEALSRIKVKALVSDIPAPVKPLLTELKQELLKLITETINDESLNGKSPEGVKVKIISKLKKVGIMLPDKDKEETEKPEYSYSEIQDITIEKSPHHDNLLVATTTLWVMCGHDTSFYIFKREEGKWNLLLAEEASNYDDITGAHSLFGYSISPPDKKGRFFVVTADVNPWCSSNWQELRYKVLRIGKKPYSPKVLLNKSDIIYLGIDPPVYKITTETERFKIEFNGHWYWSPDTGASSQYAIYRVAENRIKLMKKGRLMKKRTTYLEEPFEEKTEGIQ